MGRLTLLGFIQGQWWKVAPVEHVDLTGKTVVVIGANVGLGFEAANHFASMNPKRLVLGCRSREKGQATLQAIQATGFKNAELSLVDLTQFASVSTFADTFIRDNAQIDILVYNAAVSLQHYSPSKDGWEESIQVNHLSAVLLTILLFPCLFRAVSSGTSPNPRIVIVSSEAHFWAKFTKAEVESDKILQKLSDKNYCTSQWGIPFFTSGGSRNNLLSGSCVEDTPYQNVRNSYFSRGVLDYERFLVLNVFFVRELTKRLPANSPVIVTAVNPGFCKSQLGRNRSLVNRTFGKIMEVLLARTTEEGSRQLVWAAVGGAGREFELRGGYVNMANLEEVSDYALSDEGAAVQTRLWDESVEILSGVEPKFESTLREILSS